MLTLQHASTLYRTPSHQTVEAEPAPASERRRFLLRPEAVFWQALVTGGYLLEETRCDRSSCSATARGAPAPGLRRDEQVVLERIFQGDLQKWLALDFAVSAATVSQVAGSALTKLGLSCRVSATPLAVVLSALGHASAIEIPPPRVDRFECDGREQWRLSLPLLAPDALFELSQCERQVAELLAWGASHREISALRDVAHSTVANQIGSLSRKLRVRGRFELIRTWAARQWGNGASH
jgi:DNA-binding NarL/FixJ family response regulator